MMPNNKKIPTAKSTSSICGTQNLRSRAAGAPTPANIQGKFYPSRSVCPRRLISSFSERPQNTRTRSHGPVPAGAVTPPKEKLIISHASGHATNKGRHISKLRALYLLPYSAENLQTRPHRAGAEEGGALSQLERVGDQIRPDLREPGKKRTRKHCDVDDIPEDLPVNNMAPSEPKRRRTKNAPVSLIILKFSTLPSCLSSFQNRLFNSEFQYILIPHFNLHHVLSCSPLSLMRNSVFRCQKYTALWLCIIHNPVLLTANLPPILSTIVPPFLRVEVRIYLLC